MRHLKNTLTVIGAVAVLVLAGNTIALAATGKALILGKGNSAGAVTTISRTTAGPVLSVRSKTSAGVPLVVNGRGKVANLNADKVDGLDSTAMANRTWVWTRAISSGNASYSYAFTIPGLAAGVYQVGFSAFPNGTLVEGDTLTCFFTVLKNGDPVRYVAEDRATSTQGYRPGVSGAGVVGLGAGESLRFNCDATFLFSTFSTQPVQIFLQPTTLAGGYSNQRSVPGSDRTKH